MPLSSLRTSARSLASAGTGLAARVERRTGLTQSGVAVVGLAPALFLVARAVRSPALFMLSYGAIAVVGLAYLLARRRLVVDADRSRLPTRVREGQSVGVQLLLTARRSLSTVVIEEELPDAFGTVVQMPVSRLPSGEMVAHEYVFTARRRGVYPIGPLVATWSDPFGLTRKRQLLAEPVDLIVHPRVETAGDRVLSREWEDPPVRPPVTKRWPTGFEFYGLRDYVAGDDPRRIVWRATARSLDLDSGDGRYLVRESEQGITDRVSLLLDTAARQHSPGDPSETFETAVRVVASVASKHLKDGLSVTVHTNADRLLPPVRGQRDGIGLLDALARVQPDAHALRDGVERLMRNRRRDTHTVVVTPYLDGDAVARLRLLSDMGVSILLVLVVWEGTDPVTLHRAAQVGCNLVEVSAGTPLARVFRHVVMQSGRR